MGSSGTRRACALMLALIPMHAMAGRSMPDPLDVLSRTLSPASVPYEGVVSIHAGKDKDPLRLAVHFSPPQRYRQAILGPDGKEGRVVVSDGKTQWMYDPAKRKAWNGAAPDADDKILGPEAELELLSQNYKIRLQAQARVAGRPCWEIVVEPAKGEGPSRTVCVDVEHSLVLRSETRRPDASIAFSMRYESLRLGRPQEESLFRFQPPQGTKVALSRLEPDFLEIEEAQRASGASAHLPGWIPSGYVFESVSVIGSKRGAILHMRFSDGISALSLFQCPKGARLALGATPSRTVKLSSGRARLLLKDDETVLEWRKGGWRFILVGRLTSERLSRIAESVP